MWGDACMYYVYVLKSKNFDEVYIGYTTNLKQRIQVHNYGGSLHTAKYRPWILHVYFAFQDETTAINFEKYLKSHSGRAFAKKHF